MNLLEKPIAKVHAQDAILSDKELVFACVSILITTLIALYYHLCLRLAPLKSKDWILRVIGLVTFVSLSKASPMIYRAFGHTFSRLSITKSSS